GAVHALRPRSPARPGRNAALVIPFDPHLPVTRFTREPGSRAAHAPGARLAPAGACARFALGTHRALLRGSRLLHRTVVDAPGAPVLRARCLCLLCRNDAPFGMLGAEQRSRTSSL